MRKISKEMIFAVIGVLIALGLGYTAYDNWAWVVANKGVLAFGFCWLLMVASAFMVAKSDTLGFFMMAAGLILATPLTWLVSIL